jgi:hypothetical protein
LDLIQNLRIVLEVAESGRRKEEVRINLEVVLDKLRKVGFVKAAQNFLDWRLKSQIDKGLAVCEEFRVGYCL